MPSFLLLGHRNITYINKDTREIATDWVINHVAKNEKICYVTNHYDLGLYDIDRFISYGAGAKNLPAAVKNEMEKFRTGVTNYRMIHAYYEDTTMTSNQKNIYKQIQERYKQKSLQRLHDENVHYIITRDDHMAMYLEADETLYPAYIVNGIRSRRDFYRQLFAEYQPAVVISPSFWEKGPEISIFNIKRESNAPGQ